MSNWYPKMNYGKYIYLHVLYVNWIIVLDFICIRMRFDWMVHHDIGTQICIVHLFIPRGSINHKFKIYTLYFMDLLLNLWIIKIHNNLSTIFSLPLFLWLFHAIITYQWCYFVAFTYIGSFINVRMCVQQFDQYNLS